MADRLQPILGYLTRLTERMQKRGGRADDDAYRAAWRARDGMHELYVRLRYAGCGPGRAGNPGEGRGGGGRGA